jgi:hypothetical protein
VAKGNLRRSIIMASCLGVATVLVTGLFGHVLIGVFVCVGLGLGALNTYLVQRAVVRYAVSEARNKKARFTRSVLGRLALITVLARSGSRCWCAQTASGSSPVSPSSS